MSRQSIYTIGHSTRTIKEFIEILEAYSIKEVVDVRSIPKSRHNPQFNEDDLKRSLQESRINYVHLKELGGLRHTTKDSVNLSWRNVSFRGFADYMANAEFNAGMDTLMEIAGKDVTAIMCAEAVPWRCHRSLIGDALTIKGWLVLDILSPTSATEHKLTSFLQVKNGQLIYPEPKD